MLQQPVNHIAETVLKFRRLCATTPRQASTAGASTACIAAVVPPLTAGVLDLTATLFLFDNKAAHYRQGTDLPFN